MLRRFSINFTILSMLLDGLMVIISLISMSYLRILMNRLPFIAYLPANIHYPTYLYFIFPVIWVIVMATFSIYDGKKYLKIVDELSTFTIASFIASISQAGVLYLTYRDFSRALFLMYIFTSCLLCISWRLAARLSFRLRKETLNLSRKLMMVGIGAELHKLENLISNNLSDALSEIIVFDLQKVPEFESEIPQVCPKSIASVRSIISRYQITDVVITFPRGDSDWIEAISTNLEDLTLGVWVALDFRDLSLSDARVENITGFPLLDLRAPALDDYSRIIKRFFDIIIGSLLFIGYLPTMIIIGMIIFIIDGAPVFFTQDRVGENGKHFKMIKFRTMIRNAEKMQSQVEHVDENGDIIHKSQNDPRITQCGRILRRTSLDELPQLINVLKGEMSLVGPRPELPYLVQNYKHWQRRRLTVPPGMTGWWQIHGRSDHMMHLHTEDDIYYVENYSIWLDIRILIRTIWVILIGKGAF
jgi:exopolysaccharide biosynthesis polyprenyl glycosylphosphotransferase